MILRLLIYFAVGRGVWRGLRRALRRRRPIDIGMVDRALREAYGSHELRAALAQRSVLFVPEPGAVYPYDQERDFIVPLRKGP